MDLIGTKIVVAVLLGLLRFAFGILPIQICSWLKSEANSEKSLQPLEKHHLLHSGLVFAQCFSGGVFFATCFLYMMPEVLHSVSELKQDGVLNSRYPYSQLIVSLGFFLIYFLEEFCHWLVTITPQTPFKTNKQANVNDVEKIEQANDEKVALNYEEYNENKLEDPENASRYENESESLQGEELKNLFEKTVRTKQQVLRCAMLLTALTLHSIFEGIAIGLQHSATDIWYIFTAISIHSATELFYLGLTIFLKSSKVKTVIIHMFFLAISSPIGVLLGLFLSLTADSTSNTLSLSGVLLEGISAGTILYITFIEILGKEKERRVCRRKRATVIGAGFGIMAGLVCIT